MKMILTLISILLSTTAYNQELKLSAIIENTEPCNLEKEILKKKIMVMNPKGYSDNQLRKFRIEEVYEYKQNGDSVLLSLFNEFGDNGYEAYLADGIYEITGLKQLTEKQIKGNRTIISFDCSYNDYGKLVQLNDTVYTYLTGLKWNEYRSYILESHYSKLSEKLTSKSFTVNSKVYKITSLEAGSDGIYAICNSERIRITPAEMEKCLEGNIQPTMTTVINNKKKIDGLIDVFEKHASSYAQLHQAFNRGQKDAPTYQKYQNEKLKAHETLDKIKESYRAEPEKWTFHQRDRWLKLNDKFDLARIGLLFSFD
jgi:hypothetical protein